MALGYVNLRDGSVSRMILPSSCRVFTGHLRETDKCLWMEHLIRSSIKTGTY